MYEENKGQNEANQKVGSRRKKTAKGELKYAMNKNAKE